MIWSLKPIFLIQSQAVNIRGGSRTAATSKMELFVIIVFFLSGFSFTDTDESQGSREEMGLFFIPLDHFHPFTNFQTFICNFACEMAITYF